MKIKVPHVALLFVASTVIMKLGIFTLPGVAATGTLGTVANIAYILVTILPYAMVVLGLVAAYAMPARRIAAETAGVIGYVLAVANLVIAVDVLAVLVELLKDFDGTAVDLVMSAPMGVFVLYLISGLMYFYVAARIQDEETGGTLNAFCTLGCIMLFFYGVMCTSAELIPIRILPMILQLCYIKRLPMPFVGSGLRTSVKELVILVVITALCLVGPQIVPNLI